MENKAREELVELFKKCLEEGELPWYQGYSNDTASYNPITKTVYRNTNRFILYLNEYINGYNDPRWVTLKQANREGYVIKKGAKGVKIEYWSVHDEKENKNLTLQEARNLMNEQPERKDDLKYVSQVFTVFNGTQVEGLEPYQPKSLQLENYDEALNVMNNYLENTHLKMIEGKEIEVPYYNYKEDTISLPDRNLYYSEEAFFSDVFHEIAHSSSHESRLNRYVNTSNTYSYAMEELKAEIACAFVCLELGFNTCANEDYIENSLGYIKEWLNTLQEKPHNLFAAIAHGQKIADYILKQGGMQKKNDEA